jgi:hypothetical protein
MRPRRWGWKAACAWAPAASNCGWLRVGAPLPERLRLTLAHPTRAGEDRKVLLDGGQGHYAGELPALGPGRWQVVIEDEAANWRLAGSVQLPDSPETLLRAEGRR